MRDLVITPRELVQAMCALDTDQEDVEGVRQALRQERLVEVPQAVAARKKRDIIIRIYCRVMWVIVAAAIPLSVVKEIWPDLWLTWMVAAMIWSAIVSVMLTFFFLLVKGEEKRNVWTIGKGQR